MLTVFGFQMVGTILADFMLSGYSKFEPFDFRTLSHDPTTRLVQYSDVHCTQGGLEE